MEYQKELRQLLETDFRNTVYSFAIKSVTMFRRFQEPDSEKTKIEIFNETTPTYGWAVDSMSLICASRLLQDKLQVPLLRQDIEKIIAMLLSKTPSRPAHTLGIDEYSKQVFQTRFNFKFNLEQVVVPEDTPKTWQTILGPMLWLLLHVLATRPSEEFDLFLEHLHMFIGCMECSLHYYKKGRVYYLAWREKFGTKNTDLFLVRLHNYVSRHGENIRAPTDLTLVKTEKESEYLKYYRDLTKAWPSISN